ncbi:MAG TPA: GH92 family glycosyl hydrolase, partial [Candidatus Eremiobacteraceae bacterium]|nr:GH92 family glycosyl hydrolase [Candidatus Eremiobacteraceae bacterium]
DTTANPVVRIKAAISFVSLDEAEANQRTEATTWDFDRERRAAAGMWTAELSRVRVEGGAPGLQRTFYTALYHCMLHPNIYSDAGGSYRGFDGRVHYAERGHAEYANFSGWDIYRTEIPLLAVLEPQRTSDMMRSLVDASSQMGWLPKWSLVNVETGVMGGDPSDPMLAAAYAFGARGFDTRAALAAMVKGASLRAGNPLGQGWYEQRPALDDYVTRGYVVNVHTTNVAPLANGASLTMEYALDDFAIARVAGALGDRRDAAMMSARAQNWSNLFDRSAGLIEPRDPDGAFEQPPITEAGQSGFQEGNAAQYTWMVPQDGAGLIRAMGGRPNAVAKLDEYFSQIDAGQNAPFAWLGNEPSIGSPWAYLSAGAPWKAQRVIRDAMTQLWGDTPDGIPGNDDLGTMSAWYVLCALGLYPQEPAVPYFDLGAPSFARARVRVPGGASIDIDARGASAENAYVQSVSVGGTSWHHSWVGFSPDKPLRLDFTLGAAPNIAWGADPADAPPSYESTPVRFPASTSAQISLASTSEVDAAPGGSFPLRVRVTTSSTTVTPLSWRAGAPDGFVVTPSSGRLNPAAGSANEYDVQVTVAPHARTGIYHVWFAGQTDDGALLPRTDAVVRVARPGDHVVLAYAVNLFDNSIEPIDVASHATGAPIIVGELPRALAVSPDGKRVYVSDNGANVVSVVDTNLRRVIATVSVGRSPWGIGVTPDGATVWVANNGDDTVQPIDTATLQAGKPIAVGHTPETLTIVRDGSRLYVADPGSDDVTPVDLARRAALAPIAVGMRPRAITVSPDGKSIYASNYGSASVTPIDVATGRALPAIHAGAAPRGLAVSPDGKWLYVTDFGGGAVSVVDAATGATVKSIPVGLNPVAVAFDPRGTTAFVVNLDDNDCVAIDAASGAVSPPIRLGDRPIDIATNGGGGDL